MAPPSVAPCPARVLLVSTPSPPSLSRRRPAGRRCGGGDGGARLRTIRCGAATEEEDGDRRGERVEAAWEEEVAAPGRDLVTLAACLVGLLSGVSVVLFNLSVPIRRHISRLVPRLGCEYAMQLDNELT